MKTAPQRIVEAQPFIFPCIFAEWPSHLEYAVPVYSDPKSAAPVRIMLRYIGEAFAAGPCERWIWICRSVLRQRVPLRRFR